MRNLPTHPETTPSLSAAFKSLGDPIRLRLFHLLSLKNELCVCHLTDALALPQSTVSRHLAILRNAGLVDTRRDGKWIHYHLRGEMAGALKLLIQQHASDEIFNDTERLAAVMKGCQ